MPDGLTDVDAVAIAGIILQVPIYSGNSIPTTSAPGRCDLLFGPVPEEVQLDKLFYIKRLLRYMY